MGRYFLFRFTIFPAWLTFLCLAAITLPSQARAENSDQNPTARPVTIGVIADDKPYSFFEDGAATGFSVDILREVSAHSGLTFQFRAGSWPEIYSAFMRGELDAIDATSYQQDRADKILFTKPYHVRQTYLMQNSAHPIGHIGSLSDLSDLEGYRVGLGANIYYEDSVTRALAPNTRTFTAQEAMFQALAAISPTEMRTIEDRWLGVGNYQKVYDAVIKRDGMILFSPAEQAWLDNHQGQISYCIDNNWLPLEGLDKTGHHAGLSAEMLQLFQERSTIRFQRVPTKSWAESLEAAKTRKCDLLSMAMKTPQRTHYLNFTMPYADVPTIILGRINAPFIESVEDLKDKPVGVVRGYSFSELVSLRHPDLTLTEVSSEAEGMRLLQDDQLAGLITTMATASYSMQKLGLADLKVIGRIPEDWSASIATRNDEPILFGIMQKLVASITPEERHDLEGHWRNIHIEQSVNYSLFWRLLAIALLIAFLLIYWNRKLGRLNRELEVANQTLARLSVTDDLTQLGNRSYFDREYRKSFQWCQRHEAGFAVAMVDADLFKNINDTYGHEAGDTCLKALAEVMRHHFRRETDRLSRFGGEEFVIFTSYDERQEVIRRLDDFRAAVEGLCTVCAQRDIQLTVSIGLATGIPGVDDTPDEFLRLADQALYAAKKNGRNCLQHCKAGG